MRRKTAVGAALVAAMLTVTLDMSTAEFAELQGLPDQARRARLGMPDTCTPGLSAVKVGTGRSGRLTVRIDCKSAEPAEPPPVGSKPPR
jgi:hypothetical protein